MPRPSSRLLVPTLALIALVLLFPALATALPQGEAILSAAERHETGPGLFSKLWGLLSVLWDETGSVLEPDGGGSGGGSGAGPESGAASSGDNGSGLEPDGRP